MQSQRGISAHLNLLNPQVFARENGGKAFESRDLIDVCKQRRLLAFLQRKTPIIPAEGEGGLQQ